MYFDGPDTIGLQVRAISDRVLSSISIQLLIDPSLSVNLEGHSRGGLIAIDVASQLSRGIGGSPIAVNYLGLYDAVDRAIGMDGSVIRNVDHVTHVIRTGGSRVWFGNTGTTTDATVGDYQAYWVYGTHSAIGGDPEHGDWNKTTIPRDSENAATPTAQVRIRDGGRSAGLVYGN